MLTPLEVANASDIAVKLQWGSMHQMLAALD
jgi:hypothetical protein